MATESVTVALLDISAHTVTPRDLLSKNDRVNNIMSPDVPRTISVRHLLCNHRSLGTKDGVLLSCWRPMHITSPSPGTVQSGDDTALGSHGKMSSWSVITKPLAVLNSSISCLSFNINGTCMIRDVPRDSSTPDSYRTCYDYPVPYK